MPVDKHIKRAARDLAAADGISYTAARRALAGRADIAVPPIPPAALAAAKSDPADGYSEDDLGSEAGDAFNAAARLRYWEERRAGRLVRLWEADIEVRAAASSPDEAHWLLYVGYLHRPCFRAAGLHAESLSREPVTLVPGNEVDDEERTRFCLSYPRRPMPWSPNWDDNAAAKQFDIERYAAALDRASAEARSGQVSQGEPAPERGGLELQIYTITLTAWFLDTVNILLARERAGELAASIVDHAGRPLGRVVALEPDDGDLNNLTGSWEHPAVIDLASNAQALWDDYDAAHSGLAAHSLPRVLEHAAEQLVETWNAHTAATAAHRARRHLHPDGSRSLATPEQLNAAVAAVLAEHADASPSQLDAAAAEYEYLAARVYGRVMDTDDDEIRFDIANAQAKTLRELAEQARVSTDTAGPEADAGFRRGAESKTRIAAAWWGLTPPQAVWPDRAADVADPATPADPQEWAATFTPVIIDSGMTSYGGDDDPPPPA